MRYCRFQNTLNDLEDCKEELDNHALCPDMIEEMSDEERKARKQMIKLCKQIAEEWEN